MKYSFDLHRNRNTTEKWLEAAECGALAMGIADMDFALAPEIVEAIKECADAAEFGYKKMGEEDYKAVTDWLKYRSGVDVPTEQILATPRANVEAAVERIRAYFKK